MQCICMHACNVFSLFMKFGDTPKGSGEGGGGRGGAPDFAPVLMSLLFRREKEIEE